MDYLIKSLRYEQAGVREYWIVDPIAHATVVYRYETGDPTPRTYPFQDPISVGIWEGPHITVGDLA